MIKDRDLHMLYVTGGHVSEEEEDATNDQTIVATTHPAGVISGGPTADVRGWDFSSNGGNKIRNEVIRVTCLYVLPHVYYNYILKIRSFIPSRYLVLFHTLFTRVIYPSSK